MAITPQGCLLPSNTPPPPPLVQAQGKAKSKSNRGLDLEEVRRRTSLLSGGGRTSSPPGPGAGALSTTERRSAARRSSETSSHGSEMGWSRQQESQRSSFSSGVGVGHHLAAQHPLHSEPPPDPLFAGVVDESGRGDDVFGSAGSYDSRGNYFNEDLLLARAKGNRSASGGVGGSIGFDPLQAAGEQGAGQEGGQNAWGGDALRDTAGTFLTSARSGLVIRWLGWVELRMDRRFEGISVSRSLCHLPSPAKVCNRWLRCTRGCTRFTAVCRAACVRPAPYGCEERAVCILTHRSQLHMDRV